MFINRRKFNKFVISSSFLSLLPKKILAASYSGPINWAATSFLVANNKIKIVMPIIKGAFDIRGKKMTFFNQELYRSLQENPIIENLSLTGYEDDAKLALTLSFAAEFDFGGFDDEEKGAHFYIMRTFAYSILYNPIDRIIVATVPIRLKMLGRINKIDMIAGWKSEVLKEAFYNNKTPKKTMLEQFRIMTSKMSLSNKWEGTAARVTSVTISDKYKKSFDALQNKERSKIKYDDFINFLGLSSTTSFAYNLNLPIIPFSATQSEGAVMTVFDDTDEIEIEAPFPPTEFAIKVQLKGWKFKEKILTHPMVQITLLIVVKLEIEDLGYKKKLYSQQFSARRRFVKNVSGRLRSDVSEISILYEKLMDQAYKSIVDEDHRKKMATGIIIPINKFIFEKYNLNIRKKDPNYFKNTNEESKNALNALISIKN